MKKNTQLVKGMGFFMGLWKRKQDHHLKRRRGKDSRIRVVRCTGHICTEGFSFRIGKSIHGGRPKHMIRTRYKIRKSIL